MNPSPNSWSINSPSTLINLLESIRSILYKLWDSIVPAMQDMGLSISKWKKKQTNKQTNKQTKQKTPNNNNNNNNKPSYKQSQRCTSTLYFRLFQIFFYNFYKCLTYDYTCDPAFNSQVATADHGNIQRKRFNALLCRGRAATRPTGETGEPVWWKTCS